MVGIEKSLQKIFLTSSLFLLFPLRLDETGFHRSPWFTAFSSGHICLLVYGIIDGILGYQIDSISNTPTAAPVYNILIVAMSTSSFIAIVCPFLSINRLNELLRDLKEIDDHFCDYITSLDVRDFLKRTFCSVFFLIILTVVDLLSIQDDLFFTLLLYWNFITTQILMCQFTGLMDIFLVRFTILNQRLDMITHLKLPSIRELVALVKIYRRLSECCLKSNQIYSFQLLAYFFTYFISLATISYFLFLAAKANIDIQIVCISIDLLLLFNFYSVLSRTHNIRNEAKEFNTILYQLMIYDDTGFISSNKTLRLQIASKDDIIFTACGFFKLDLTLFINMVGAVTTYCVILIQMV